MFQVELQYDDIKGPTEVDMTRIPEFPASAALQSIEGQNLKGAAFDVLQAYADQARMADMRHEAFYTLAQETGIPAAQLQPMVDLNPDLIAPRPTPAAEAHVDLGAICRGAANGTAGMPWPKLRGISLMS